MGPRIKAAVESYKPLTVTDYLRHKSKIHELRMSFCAWWKSQGLDHIITPGYGCQPNLNEITGEIFSTVMYTSVWNTLNMPVGALPITVVREDEQHYESAHNDSITRRLRQTAQGSAGLPVGILVVGLPFEEEKILSLMKSIEEAVGFEKNRRIVKLPKA